MASMTVRTTVAFDPATVARWERLSKRWGVSKSEALRRALEAAELPAVPPTAGATAEDSAPEPAQIAGMSPAEALVWLESHSLCTAEAGQAWREEVRKTREDFALRP